MTVGARPLIVHVIGSLHAGGAERVMERLILGTINRFDHRVVAMLPGGRIGDSFREAGVPVVVLAAGRAGQCLAPLRLRKLLGELRPDLIHGWMYHANVLVTVASMASSFKTVWGIRTMANPERERRSTAAVMRLSAGLASRPRRIIYNSHAAATTHHAMGYPSTNGVVIHNGLDMRRFTINRGAGQLWREAHDLPREARVALLPGRLHPVKGHRRLLRNLPPRREGADPWYLVFVGRSDGVAEEVLQHDAYEAGWGGFLRIIPATEAIELALQAADLVVSPSEWGESFPNVVLEALACGVPVVASDLGDVREILGSAGWIVPPGTDAELASVLRVAMAMDSSALRALGQQGREHVQGRFDIHQMLGQYGDELMELAKR